MRRRLPELFVVVALISAIGNAARGDLVFGVFIGVLWLGAAYVQYRRREHPPEPDAGRT